MKGFDSKFIDELKSKNDIVDVIGRYVHLEQRGDKFWGRCPFHHEKTASFCVNSIEQYFHCFGCKKSGTVIYFVQEIEALDYVDTIKFLADRVGMKLPNVEYNDEQIKEQKRKKERLLSLMRDTALFYAHNLRTVQAEKHLEYVEKRKISNEFLIKFGIGASLDYEGLPKYLKSKGYAETEMIEAGACGGKNGRVYDFLAGRLIIPVIDQFNNVVAFCGRIIENKKDVGKYVNTRETSIFSKGKLLFNVNNLKKLKNEKGLDNIIIVEGHMDVVSLVQGGFPNVVASMGTALTKDHARMLKRYADKIYISYDGDFAGQKATVRGLEILKEEGLDVKVISLPDGMDPDDVITKLGKDGYNKCILDALPLIDFKLLLLKKTFDLSTQDGKRKYVTNAFKVIRESSSPAEQEDLIKEVKKLTGYTYESLKRELDVASVENQTVSVALPQPNFVGVGDKLKVASRFVLYSYLFNRSYVEDLSISDFEFVLPEHKAIQKFIENKQKQGETVRFSDAFDELGDIYPEELSLVSGMETDDDRKNDGEYFLDCTRALKLSEIENGIKNLTAQCETVTNETERKEIMKKINSLYLQKKRYIKI